MCADARSCLSELCPGLLPSQLGALMNEAYQAHDGLPPSLFPPDIPTYTGAAAVAGGSVAPARPWVASPVCSAPSRALEATPCRPSSTLQATTTSPTPCPAAASPTLGRPIRVRGETKNVTTVKGGGG